MIGYFLEILELVQGTCPNSKTIDSWTGNVTGFGLRTGTLNQLQNFEKISDHRKNLKNVLFGTKTESLSDKVVWERPSRAPERVSMLAILYIFSYIFLQRLSIGRRSGIHWNVLS